MRIEIELNNHPECHVAFFKPSMTSLSGVGRIRGESISPLPNRRAILRQMANASLGAGVLLAMPKAVMAADNLQAKPRPASPG